MNCYPWWHATLQPMSQQSWASQTISSGCAQDSTGNIPCPPEAMRESAAAWLARYAPQAITTIGGALDQDTYTFARYMTSEVGSGTIEERIAVGEAALNQAKRRAGVLGSWRSKLREMLVPNGKYGAIHAPDAYCKQLGMSVGCNPARRWAATSRDPTAFAIVLAHFVMSGQSGDFARGAETQWGPEYLRNTDNTYLKNGTTQARIESFVRYAASDSGGRYYWVGQLPGVDPWHTWLAKKGPAASSPQGLAMIAQGIAGLPLSGGRPQRIAWPADLPACDKPASGLVALATGVGIAAVLWYGSSWWTNRNRTA